MVAGVGDEAAVIRGWICGPPSVVYRISTMKLSLSTTEKKALLSTWFTHITWTQQSDSGVMLKLVGGSKPE